MSKYLPTRKMVDIWVCDWEKQHSKGNQTESLEMFISKESAKYLVMKLNGDTLEEKLVGLDRLAKELGL